MTDIQVPIAIGKANATALSSASLAAGTLIQNNDAANSVWVSAEPSMGSGYGLEIGPKGSAVWQTTSPCYAILDSAATAGVTLYLSQSLSEITDPVAIGAAVATRLLLSGVPNVFLNPQLLHVVLDGLHPTTAPIDISGYASLIVQLATGTTPIQYDMHQESPFDASKPTITEVLTNIDGGSGFIGTWAIPVMGSTIQFKAIGGGNQELYVYGSNRQIPSPVMLGNNMLSRKLGYTGNATIGVTTQLISTDSSPWSNTSFNRMCFARCAVGAQGGSIGYQYEDAGGVTRTNFIALSLAANASAFVSFAHPLSVCRWVGQPNTTGATTFLVDVTQESI